jgi:ApbE superfamily uncharacterized protein (UPF0280 family)
MAEPKVVPESTPAQIAAAAANAPATAEDAIEANRKEYGQYVAAEPIYFGTALAYNPGDAVPADNVARHKYLDDGKVVKVGTKAHKELREALGLPPLES